MKKLIMMACALVATMGFASDKNAVKKQGLESDKKDKGANYFVNKKSPVKVCYETKTPKSAPKLAA